MEENISLKILGKRFAANNLKIFFGRLDGGAQKVLILSGLAAFIETEFNSIDSYVLQVREGVSVYGLDMSMRLKKPEYKDYKEVFLFVNKPGTEIALRALSKNAVWCDIDKLTADDLNY